MINRGSLKGGKIIIKIVRGLELPDLWENPEEKFAEFESQWPFIPEIGEIVDFSNCDVDELHDIPEKRFRCCYIEYMPRKGRSMGDDVDKVDVYVSLMACG